MQIERSRRVITGLMDLCDKIISNFHIAASSGMTSNKMACIEFSYKTIYEASRTYNLLVKDLPFVEKVNAALQDPSANVESVEQLFGVMFMCTQQFKLQLKAWQDALE